MYSSIEEISRKDVIKKCYWPLFKLADIGIPIGIEAPAVTLNIIQKLEPSWIETLSKYIAQQKIEFIGSGYSQIIAPLVPAKVNQWNQKLGLDRYEKLLNFKPKLALVNEMAYSGGILEHYINAGYKGLIMEWNNPRAAHSEWNNEWRYFPQKAIGANGKTIPLIWADSIAFQKYQRYTHGEYELNEYVEYIKSHLIESDRFFPLYSNDVEIFDFRPGRYQTEVQFGNDLEWDRSIELFIYLHKQAWCDFVFPSQVLSGLRNENGGNRLKLETPSQPIPVKKQEKYNMNRWALTGRDDLSINSKCYQIYNSLIKRNNNNNLEELCYLWSSDFRTHITKKRWNNYCARLTTQLTKCDYKNKVQKNKLSNRLEIHENQKWIELQNNNYKIVLNKNKGLTIQKLVYKQHGSNSLIGTLDHGYYDDISLGADYYSGHAVIERPGEHKITDLGKVNLVIDQNVKEIVAMQKLDNYSFKQKITLENKNLVFEKHIQIDKTKKTIIRPYNFTFNPEAWNKKSLYIATHNGGSVLEKFYLKGQNFSHGDIYSSLISSRHGFGNTEGVIIVGDKNKSILFQCNLSSAALIPSIIYKEMDETIFFRLTYSAREMDETMKNHDISSINTELNISIG